MTDWIKMSAQTPVYGQYCFFCSMQERAQYVGVYLGRSEVEREILLFLVKGDCVDSSSMDYWQPIVFPDRPDTDG